jgi:hypothetical protein
MKETVKIMEQQKGVETEMRKDVLTMNAELVNEYLKHFSPDATFVRFLVEDNQNVIEGQAKGIVYTLPDKKERFTPFARPLFIRFSDMNGFETTSMFDDLIKYELALMADMQTFKQAFLYIHSIVKDPNESNFKKVIALKEFFEKNIKFE